MNICNVFSNCSNLTKKDAVILVMSVVIFGGLGAYAGQYTIENGGVTDLKSDCQHIGDSEQREKCNNDAYDAEREQTTAILAAGSLAGMFAGLVVGALFVLQRHGVFCAGNMYSHRQDPLLASDNTNATGSYSQA